MSGIGAIIDGAFKGYSFGEAVKDKKAARKIRDEELEWAREDRDYLKTKRGWEAEDREVSVAERNRQIAASDEAERVHREAYETAQDEHATRGAPNPAELPGVTAAPVAPAAPGGASPNPNQPLGRSMRPTPAPEAPRTGPAPMTPPSAPPDAAPRSMAPGMVSTRSAPTQPATDQIPQSFLTDPVIQERLAQSTIPADRVWAHMNEQTKQAWRDKDAASHPQTPPAPQAPATMSASPQRPAAPTAEPAPVMPAPSQRTMRRTPPSDLPSNAAIEQEAAARSEDPNVEASRAATVKTMKTPDMTKTRAADSFLDTYRRVAVPQIIDHYLKTGDIDKAKSFETWVKTSEAEQLQTDFGKLTYSLAIGDLNASIDHLTEMYESINDGYSVNRGESRFETYENGQPSRLVVVVEDAEGNKFDWVVEDQGDLAAQVLGLVNPQAAHQYLLERNEAAVAARAANSKSIKPAPIDRKEVTGEVKRIKDDLIEQQGQALLSGQPFQMPPDSEIEQMAVENLRARDAAISGGGNRSFQPNGTPVPDWVP